MDVNIGVTTLCNQECKMEDKVECLSVSDFASQSEWQLFPKTFVKEYHRDYENESETEMNEEVVTSNFCPENKRQYFNENPAIKVQYKNDSDDREAKIQEQLCWLETTSTEVPSIDEAKDGVDDNFPTTGSIRFAEVSKAKSRAFSAEDSEKNARFQRRKIVLNVTYRVAHDKSSD